MNRIGKKVNRRAWLHIAFFTAVVVAVAIIPLFVSSPYFLDLVVQILLWSAAASAWNIVGGYGGELSLGHAGFFGIGAYTSTLLFLNAGVSPWIGMLVGALLAAAAGLVLGTLTLRLTGPFFALLTLAFGQMLLIVTTDWRSLTQGSNGLSLPFQADVSNFLFSGTTPYLYAALLLAASYYLFSVALEHHRIGYFLVALRENENAARALGVRATQLRLFAFCLSAALTAVCGTFYAQYIRFIDPASVTGLDISLRVALIAILGGVGTASGPVVGSVIVIFLTDYLRGSTSAALGGSYLAIYGLVMMTVVLLAPNGIVGIFRKIPMFVRRYRTRDEGDDIDNR